MRRVQAVRAEVDSQALGFDPTQNTVYAFLLETYRALVFQDRD
jgi:hypothetical protein